MPTLQQVAELLDPKKLPLPSKPKVLDIRVYPYVDHLGDDALEIWVILDDSTTRKDRSVANRRVITRAISDTLLKAGIDWFPYIQMATPSELKQAGMES
jgi:hypothetical protein